MYRVERGKNETSLRFVRTRDQSTNVVETDFQSDESLNLADFVLSKTEFIEMLTCTPMLKLLMDCVTRNEADSPNIYLSRRKLLTLRNAFISNN